MFKMDDGSALHAVKRRRVSLEQNFIPSLDGSADVERDEPNEDTLHKKSIETDEVNYEDGSKEAKAGITEFVSPVEAGFNAVLKHRYVSCVGSHENLIN